MRFRVLGPLEVLDGDRPVPIGGGHQRGLLALLLVHAGEIVSRDRVIDELWRGAPPARAAQSLDAYVSRLRRALRSAGGDGLLITRQPGYILEPGSIDAAEFEASVHAGEAALADGDAERASTVLRAGLELWRGQAYVEVADETWAKAEAERLEELRLSAIETRIDAELTLGSHTTLVPELELLVARHSQRERLVGQLMLALYRSGRQGDALAAYRNARTALVDLLGIEPSPKLRGLEAAILAQDPSLDPVVDPRAAPAPARGERKEVTVLAAGVADSLERAAELDPEAWRRVLREVVATMRASVHRLGGTVDKVTSEGVVAVFGAPIAFEDHARRACYAALDLRGALQAGLVARVGIDSGEVVTGALEDQPDSASTAVGRTVAIAQRIEQLATPGTIFVSDATASLTSGFFSLRDLGAVESPGATASLHLHELLGVGSARGVLDVARARSLSSFVGRERELRALGDAFRHRVRRQRPADRTGRRGRRLQEPLVPRVRRAPACGGRAGLPRRWPGSRATRAPGSRPRTPALVFRDQIRPARSHAT